ncbi:MAG: hypothetical protein NUW12_12750 [Firmicutes bacterium]|jgi:hypothetical protein|nr:hypothetical protein [Bacillota bacterium]MDH7496750.1 hypothetical protein [Bacillota bacterium]
MALETRSTEELKGYANQVIFDVVKAFWDERGLGARFRLYNVGKDYFLDKFGLRGEGCGDFETVVTELSRGLKAEGIAEKLSVERREENVLTVKVSGCIHRPVEEKLAAAGVAPFFCPCTNLVMALAQEALGMATEQACIEVRGDECIATVVLFKRPEPDGVVG